MNTSKIVTLGQNLNNSSGAIKVIKSPNSVLTYEQMANGMMVEPCKIQMPDGKIFDNMLDIFKAATGTQFLDIMA